MTSTFLGEDPDDRGIADSQHTPGSPQSMPSRASHRLSNFFDDSGPVISKYLKWAEEYDKRMAQSWKEEADKVFLFTGLFSAVVASLISVSIQDVQQNPQSVSNFYLANLQSLAQSKQPETSTPPQFNPPTTAVWVNSLWFLSLAINLACSVLANLLQQWARRYIRGTHTRYSPKKRARTRAFYARGVEKFRLPLVFEALPAMLHLSVFLFAAGLVVFLWNIDPILSKVVAVWLAICLFLYYFFTLGPIEYHDSPYDTPLSMPVWYLWTRIHFLIVWNLGQFTCFSASSRLQTLERKYRKFLGQGFFKTANKTALKSPFEVDTAFLNDLEEDPDMDHLFAGLHTFQGSKPDPLSDVAKKAKAKQMKAFVGYLDSTFSSDFLTELSMARRAIFYANALDPAELPHAHQFILDGVLSGDHHKGLKSAEFGRFMRGWSDGGDGTSASVVQAICSGIVAKARRRDDSWFAFASDEMVILEPDLRAYAAHGKSLSLAIFIHLARQQFSHFGDSSWPEAEFSKVLGEAASKFKVQHTLPELQHKFCALWNEIVLKARTDNNNWTIAGNILGQMRGIYNTLHPETGSATTRPPAPAPAPGTDNVVTHPACNVPDHIPSAASAPTILFDNGVPPPDNEAPIPGPSHLARETTTQGLHPADAFPDTIVPRVTGSIDTSIVTIPLTTLASAPPPTSAPGVSGHRTAPNDPGVPSALDLGNIIPIGSHSLALVPTASVPAGGEGSAKAALHKTIDVLQPSSAIRMATPDAPPHSSAADVVAPGSSQRSDRIADHPLHPSNGKYDIV